MGELEADAEGETDWTWRQQEEETGRQRQLDNERTRLWVCDRQEEYVLPHPPTTYNIPTTQPRVVGPHARQHSLSSSPAGTLKPSTSTSTYSSTSPTSTSSSSSLPIRNNHVKIEAALAKFDLLSDIVAIHRKEQSLYSSEGSELELGNELGDYYENEKAWPQAYSRRGVNSAVS